MTDVVEVELADRRTRRRAAWTIARAHSTAINNWVTILPTAVAVTLCIWVLVPTAAGHWGLAAIVLAT